VSTTAANHVAGEIGYCQFHAVVPSGTDLYTTPPQRTWVGLTDGERLEAAGIDVADVWFWEVVEAIEAKLKEKNA
jgi:hypothetical protein